MDFRDYKLKGEDEDEDEEKQTICFYYEGFNASVRNTTKMKYVNPENNKNYNFKILPTLKHELLFH